MDLYTYIEECQTTDYSLDQYSEDRIKKLDLVNFFIRFSKYEYPISYWRALFIAQLVKWGFNKESAFILSTWGQHGHNWRDLWPTDDIEETETSKVLEKFYSEVSYCSDRMGMDRLFRCHWLFNYYRRRAADEQIVKGGTIHE